MRDTETEASNAPQFYFCIYLTLVALARLFLVHDIDIPMINGPHDGSLYASRAFYFVTQLNFGPFDGRLFVKDLGASIAMAVSRWLGLSYVSFLNLLHLGAALYFAFGLVRIGLSRVVSGFIFAVALFAPITFSGVWFDNTRENLDTILHFWFFAALMIGLVSWRQGKSARVDILFVALAGAGAFFVREEAILLLAVPALVVAIEFARVLVPMVFRPEHKSLWSRLKDRASWSYLLPPRNWPIRASILLLAMILLVKLGLMAVLYERHGLLSTATNDFNSGAFPRFIAALRSASGAPTRPFVSITREGMRKVGEQIPYLKRVAELMPPPPTPDSPLGQRFGVWDEWSNSHIFFWIKDAAFQAGYTPNPAEAQAFFRRAAIDIENACAAKTLTCTKTSRGVLAPVQWSWINDIWSGIGFGLLHTASARFYGVATRPDGLLIGAEGAGSKESLRLGRMYEFVAKIPFDSLRQNDIFGGNANTPMDAAGYYERSVGYWCRYLDIAVHKDFGVTEALTPEFYQRFSQVLGLQDTAADWSQLSDHKNRARIEAFLAAHPAKDCWEPSHDPVLAAVLSYLQQQNGKLDGLLKSPFTGALNHYVQHGQAEGRIWAVGNPAAAPVPSPERQMVVYRPVTIKIRQFIYDWFFGISKYVYVIALISLLLTVRWWKENAMIEPVGILAAYIGIKIVILAYIAITIGLVDVRLYASSHYSSLILSLAFIAYNLQLFKHKRAARRLAREPAMR